MGSSGKYSHSMDGCVCSTAPPEKNLVPYRLPWYRLNAQCQVEYVDHAARGYGMGQPPPPRVDPASLETAPLLFVSEGVIPRMDYGSARVMKSVHANHVSGDGEKMEGA